MDKRPDIPFLPVLGNGEVYVEGLSRKGFGGEARYRTDYAAARDHLKHQLRLVRRELSDIPHNMKFEQFVFTVRVYPEFLAKSYHPSAFIRMGDLVEVGSRRWMSKKPASKRDKQLGHQWTPATSKMIFVRATDEGLQRLEYALDQPESSLPNSFREDVRKVETISFLSSEERFLGFGQEWTEGLVEMVLHPFGNLSDEVQLSLSEILVKSGVKPDDIIVRPYYDGPTFVCAYCHKASLAELSQFNPLRTVHPVFEFQYPSLRSGVVVPGPFPAPKQATSNITVGVFDGGLDENNPLLKGFAKSSMVSVPQKPIDELVSHGNAVAGVVLYGPLNEYSVGSTLPVPAVNVEMFRVLPLKNPRDAALYEAIDLIERVIPERPDIKVYNLSFGPRQPILDDEITRFTYALDYLAWKYRVLFVVAVGNDGAHSTTERRRVQPPSDVVNGLGVGACIIGQDGIPKRAFYSSLGPGREGCKIKPDVVAQGGCDQKPLHLVGNKGSKVLSMGTSFAAPMVAGRAAELLGRCDRIHSLAVRALLIHTAERPERLPGPELGHGLLKGNVEDILRCSERSVTVIYQGSLSAATWAKLPLTLPKLRGFQGNVLLKWTIVLMSRVDRANPDEYTTSCVEDTFYPHSEKYTFTSPDGQQKRLNLVTQADQVKELLRFGWSQSELPVSESANIYLPENVLRTNYKWDTVVQRMLTKRYSSLNNPFIVLHGMGRNGIITGRLDYALVLTFSIPSYRGDLYTDTVRQFNRLEPLRLRSVSEVLVPVR